MTASKAILLFSQSDRRGEIVGPRIVVTYDGPEELPIPYEERFRFFKEKLESPKVVDHIIETCCLLEDRNKFNGDETFAFHKVEYKDFGFVYTFRNAAGRELEFRFCIEDVKIV